MDTTNTTKQEISHLLRPVEVAAMLNISKSLAYRLLQQGEIPTVRFGHSVRVRFSDLEAFIQQNLSSQQ